jgi:hypothetical protein
MSTFSTPLVLWFAPQLHCLTPLHRVGVMHASQDLQPVQEPPLMAVYSHPDVLLHKMTLPGAALANEDRVRIEVRRRMYLSVVVAVCVLGRGAYGCVSGCVCV